MNKLICILLLDICAFAYAQSAVPAGAKEVAERFQIERMRADLKFLASDLLEGRGTGARGGRIGEEYIVSQFEMAGLKPLGDNGTYLQKVPLIGLTTQPETSLTIVPQKGKPFGLRYLDEFVANALTLKKEETIKAPLVFVGYGVTAPEFQWNDFQGINVKGKVLLCLVNDPPSEDPRVFGGRAMTYYGRWTYKFEEAARQGATGILLVHNEQMAAYGWGVVRNSNSGEQAYLENPPGEYVLPMAGWVTEETAGRIAIAAGTDLRTLFEKAKTRGFRAMELPLTMEGKLIAQVRPLEAHNVIAMLEGSDPERKEEAIVYTAHHDHLGIGNPIQGDNIYNGAEDNASGTALLLEMARAFTESPTRPARSVVFLAVTAEERGLRGSEYYGKVPKIFANKTMLDLNYDGLALWGETSDVTLTGAERTSVWPIVKDVAKELGYRIEPEAHPEAGYYYRSDHFSLARVGIPSFSIDPGNDYVGKPKSFGDQKYKEYIEKHYHQPSDEYNPQWDFSGAKKLAALGVAIGWRVAELPESTGWVAGDEFEKLRK
ncbi:M28 family peptidase [bacterium]|nr:M28 family peptidase [bacterium]MCI0605408.1 M28 family peptidase [bacterium]